MTLVVQKYGGSSVADAECVQRVARRVAAAREAGHDVVVVVSAMGDTTDELLDLADRISTGPAGRELDMLLTAGERISMALLAMAVTELGHHATSFTGSQAGVNTDAAHGRARIVDVAPDRIRTALAAGSVVIVAGFQGIAQDTQDVTTLGRGGSDTTAVALAAALDADLCEIYTDVDGVFSADPRIVPTARLLPALSYDEMLELAAHGAKILHSRCVEFAKRYQVPLRVRSSFADDIGSYDLTSAHAGTHITSAGPDLTEGTTDHAMEDPLISGIAHDRSQSKITVLGIPDKPGAAATVFTALAGAGCDIDMIVQNVSAEATSCTDISFTLPASATPAALEALQGVEANIGFLGLRHDDRVGKLSVVGAGMRSHPGVSATLFSALAETGVNIQMISTSEIRISVVVHVDDLEAAVGAAHTAFGLDSEQIEAVVYGGTGR
ncbi:MULTISPECIES: aspartate kinase [unclassified Streptomyces]|uniref:aspartate kinase n=1 Tax=unclassified Streptomyces TaxID=2593676 RepID=UPI0006190A14|nr:MULTISPECIES: aspartate kinase [unclassified Streptomyces]KKD07536.1 aspartate kinase [Streptomyces sp. WM6386]KKD15147.1 aspartate kinase [Streptomyces sp. WM6391]